MPRSKAGRPSFLAAFLATSFYGAPALAQDPEWGPLLTDQMMVEYDCEVAFFSQVAEREVNGEIIVIAKVHCVDQRSFDAYRPGSFALFEIHPCENPENRVC